MTKKTLACEELLADISSKTEQAKEKQQLAQAKSVEIEEQNKVIAVEKVHMYKLNMLVCSLRIPSVNPQSCTYVCDQACKNQPSGHIKIATLLFHNSGSI